MRSEFGVITTVAGLGASDEPDEWREQYEGGDATRAELSRPHMAMGDAAGNLYIADKESHGIRRVDTHGVITTVAGTNERGDGPDDATAAIDVALDNPNGLWVQPDGRYYVVDLGNSKVRRVDSSGTMTTLISIEDFTVGRGLWVAEDESEAYVASGTTLLRWTPEEGVTTFATGFASLGMVVRAPGGELLVGDRGGHRVYSLDSEGEKTPIAGDGATVLSPFVDGAPALETGFDEPRAVWPYAGGVFVGMHAGRRVVYVDDQGIAHDFLAGEGDVHAGDGERYDSPSAKISEVRSVTMNAARELVIVEHDVGYVRVVHRAD